MLQYIDGNYIDEDGVIQENVDPYKVNKEILYKEDSIIPFGKHKGKTIRYIMKKDPSYLKWMKLNGFSVDIDPIQQTNNKRYSQTSDALFNVFKRKFTNHMDNHMFDKHPEIFDARWEDEITGMELDIDHFSIDGFL